MLTAIFCGLCVITNKGDIMWNWVKSNLNTTMLVAVLGYLVWLGNRAYTAVSHKDYFNDITTRFDGLRSDMTNQISTVATKESVTSLQSDIRELRNRVDKMIERDR